MAVRTKRLELDLPEELFRRLGEDPEKVKTCLLQALVLDLVRQGEITSSYGAKLLEMNYHDFLALMAAHDVPVISYSPEELDQELEALKEAFP